MVSWETDYMHVVIMATTFLLGGGCFPIRARILTTTQEVSQQAVRIQYRDNRRRMGFDCCRPCYLASLPMSDPISLGASYIVILKYSIYRSSRNWPRRSHVSDLKISLKFTAFETRMTDHVADYLLDFDFDRLRGCLSGKRRQSHS